MPPPRKPKNDSPAPRKRAPRKATPTSSPAPTGIATKRAQVRGEDATTVDPYAPTVWADEDSSGALVDLTLPSGQLVLAQRPGPEGLMVAGLLDDLDMLGTILPKVMGGKNTTKKDFNPTEVMKNPKLLGDAIKLMNRVVVHVVIKPELTPEPEDPRDKQRGKIYPSSVSQEDKMFIFNWAVGGTRDIATFRQQHQESVASVDAGEDMERPA